MNIKNNHHLYAILAVFCWALAFVLTKMAMAYYSVGALAFARYFFAAVALIIILIVCKSSLPRKKDILLFLLSGFLGFAFYTLVFNKGTAMVTAATSSLVVATSPIITAFLASLVYKEKLHLYQWLAIFIEFVGIGILTLWNGVLSINVGILWLLIAALSFSLYNFAQRRLLKTYQPVEAVAFSIFAAVFMLSPYSLEMGSTMAGLGIKLGIAVILLAVVGSVFSNILWTKALSLSEKTTGVTNYMFVTPVVTAIMGFLMLEEIPDTGTILGGIIIVFGLFLFNKNSFTGVFQKQKS
jgi:drug/metabolite transporter (DMT)-like permease